MLIFTIIIFGLATIRTIVPLVEKDNWTAGQLITTVTMVIAYIWFLNQFISLK